ncbi:MAG: non-canonical purine NTP pyrophosphatase [Candidatus Heimdallarchaeota archaeon]|nr:non-canonical purine NTP pyrophosphatase [Candidatus Heimdallarchaeota archaeon]
MPYVSPFHSITFATSNINKFREIQNIFQRKSNYKLQLLPSELLEIQANSLEEVAAFSLENIIWEDENQPIFVEDSGLFISELNGFPGPYSSYIYQTIGLKGVLALLKGTTKREAVFKSVIALKYKKITHICVGAVQGSISESISDLGWGYDPIFIPDGTDGKTFGEIQEKKNYISHRYFSSLKLIQTLETIQRGED